MHLQFNVSEVLVWYDCYYRWVLRSVVKVNIWAHEFILVNPGPAKQMECSEITLKICRWWWWRRWRRGWGVAHGKLQAETIHSRFLKNHQWWKPFCIFIFICFSLQITQIFSLADNPTNSGADVENQLMKLLHALRSSALPILWYAIMVEGPQLQLIQCSKESAMTDTTVLIDPGFCYQVTVQKQPLLPTHSLYDTYPGRLTSVTEVVNLLLGLAKYVMCQGLPPKQPSSNKDPVILARASTCDFLVRRKVRICANCRAMRGL